MGGVNGGEGKTVIPFAFNDLEETSVLGLYPSCVQDVF